MHFQWKAGPPGDAAGRVADLGGVQRPNPAAPPTAAGGNTLVQLAQAMDQCATGVQKKGQTSPCAKLAQALLANKFGFQIVADGIFGPATHNAVVAFQKAKGLAADGVVGKNTWAALRADRTGRLSGQVGPNGSAWDPSIPSKMSSPA